MKSKRSSPSTHAIVAPAASAGPIHDLLGDDDSGANENAQIHTNSAEIGNLQNKLASTQRSLKSTQEERKTLEETIAAQASQLSSLQSQLSTATSAYDTEKKLLENLQERMSSQNNEIQITKADLIRRESELSALKIDKGEVEGSLLRDKEEVRQLQQQMKEMNDNTELIKVEIERARKEARQQKGMVAIAKKQLLSSQAEREKVIKELEAAKLELEEVKRDLEETEAQVATNNAEIERTKEAATRTTSPPPAEVAAMVQLPVTPDVQPSTTSFKSTNPFEKLARTNSQSNPGSPFQSFTAVLPTTQPEITEASPHNEKRASLDDPFGLESEQLVEEAHEPILDNNIKPEVAESMSPAEDKTDPEIAKEEVGPVASPPTSTKFPDLEDISPKSPEKTDIGPETDAAKEIEPVDESDSSDDDIPLGTLKKVHNGDIQPKIPPGLPNSESATPVEPSAFDDVFAPATANSMNPVIPKENAPTNSIVGTFDSAFGENLVKDASKEEPKVSTKPKATGVDAFDEAMSKMAPSQATSEPQFSFESNFGDTFDFGTSVIEAPTIHKPLETPAPVTTRVSEPVKESTFPTLPPIATDSQPLSFDDAFGRVSPKPDAQTNGVGTKATNGETSFDDIFKSKGPLAIPTASGSSANQVQETARSPRRNTTSIELGAPSPRVPGGPSSPTSPDRTMSSHRSTSPTPRRPLSPPIRKSSGSKQNLPEDKKSHKLSVSSYFFMLMSN